MGTTQRKTPLISAPKALFACLFAFASSAGDYHFIINQVLQTNSDVQQECALYFSLGCVKLSVCPHCTNQQWIQTFQMFGSLGDVFEISIRGCPPCNTKIDVDVSLQSVVGFVALCQESCLVAEKVIVLWRHC